jgi:hypothetical protein
MRKLYLAFILISCLVMLPAAAGGACTQPKPLTGSAGAFQIANRPMKEGLGSDEP